MEQPPATAFLDTATSDAPTPGARRDAGLQMLILFSVLGLWLTAFKGLGLQALVKARLPTGWVYVDIIGTGVIGTTALALLLWRSRQDWTSVGLRRVEPGPAIGIGLLATLPCYAAGAVIQLVTLVALRQTADQLASQKLAALDILSHVPFAMMVPLALFAGVYEEILFRGFLLSRLATVLHSQALGRKRTLALAAFLSSALFALGHAYQGVGGMAQTFAVGAVMCAVAIWRGNIWSCIVGHAAIDTFGLFALRVLKPVLEQALETVKAAAAADAGR